MASTFAIVHLSSQPGAKRFAGVSVGYFHRPSLTRGVHYLHTHSTGQNSVKWLPLIMGKAVEYSQARFPRRGGNELLRILRSREQRKAPQARNPKIGFSVLMTHY